MAKIDEDPTPSGELALQTLAEADCVCFDVDSTVINEEGIVSGRLLLSVGMIDIFVSNR